MHKLGSIQALRGVAALAVVVCHTAGWQLGAAGVDLFFVISGFIMATVSVGRPPIEFFAARIRRIYPLYWICSLAVVIASWSTLSPADLVSTLTLWPVLPSGMAFPVLPPAWSLCFEMLFYVGCAFALATAWRIPILIYAVCLAANSLDVAPTFRFVGNPLALEFIAGFMLAKAPRHEAAARLLLMVGILILVLSPAAAIAGWPTIGKPLLMFSRAAWWGIPAVAIVYAALCHEGLSKNRWLWPLMLVGDASYSIYLTHVIPNNLFVFWWPLQTAILLGIGLATYALVERVVLRPKTFLAPTAHLPQAGRFAPALSAR